MSFFGAKPENRTTATPRAGGRAADREEQRTSRPRPLERQPSPTAQPRVRNVFQPEQGWDPAQNSYAPRGGGQAVERFQDIAPERNEGNFQLASERQNEARNSFASQLQGGASFETKQMSWDDYNALTPQKRAVIDANTALVRAIDADKQLREAEPEARGDDSYNDAVAGLFGEDGGSNLYSPNTVGLLQQLGIANKGRNDLDNFLNLRSLVTEGDLTQLSDDAIAQGGSLRDEGVTAREGQDQFAGNARLQNAARWSSGLDKRLGQVLASGTALLASTKSSGLAAGAAAPDLDAVFDFLASREIFDTGTEDEIANAFSSLKQMHPGLEDDAISSYFEQRLKAFDYGASDVLGRQAGDYVSTAEFRRRYFDQPGS